MYSESNNLARQSLNIAAFISTFEEVNVQSPEMRVVQKVNIQPFKFKHVNKRPQ